MLKNIFHAKENWGRNTGFITLLVIIFADSIGNGMSQVILPAILNNLGGKTAWLGTIIGIQSLLGIVIFLPQASFIKKFGEKFSVRLGILVNIIVYILYLFNQQIFIATGKFVEGMADRLMNSSISKVIYDQTDGKNNRGQMRAYMDSVRSIGIVISPAIAAWLLRFSIQIPIIIVIIGLSASFVFSKKLSENVKRDAKENMEKENQSNHKSLFRKYYLDHIKQYALNKYIVAITIPSILFACLDIFYSVLLNLYLLNYKGFSYAQIAALWSAISVMNILLQIPSGFLADKKKHVSFLLCVLLNVIGFGILVSNVSSIYLLIGAVSLINIGCVIYTTAMSALFGDLTTKEHRLSESESYRMIRGIGEGLLTITLSFIFDKSPVFTLKIIGVLIVLGSLITLIINGKYYKSMSRSERESPIKSIV